MPYDIIVVGSCNIDLTSYVDRAPAPGETISGNSFYMTFGGKGANQAVMSNILGGNVAFVGKVGTDHFSKIYLDHFSLNGMTTEFVEQAKNASSSGTASIIVSKEGQNSIIIHGGANLEVDVEYVRRVLPPLLTHAKVLLVQMEIDPSATLEALKLARQAHVITIFNTAPASKSITPEFLKYSDIICSNEIEISQITGIPIKDDQSTYQCAAEAVYKSGVRHVILTLGEKGAMLFNTEHPQGQHATITHNVGSVVDTTGSGDAFLGALSFLIVDRLKNHQTGEYIDIEVVKKAVDAATQTVSFKGAQASYFEALPEIRKILKLAV